MEAIFGALRLVWTDICSFPVCPSKDIVWRLIKLTFSILALSGLHTAADGKRNNSSQTIWLRRSRPGRRAANQRTGMSNDYLTYGLRRTSRLPTAVSLRLFLSLSATEKLGIVNFRPARDEASDEQLASHCYFGARFTPPR